MKLTYKKVGFILLAFLLLLFGLIYLIVGLTRSGFNDSRLRNANNILATLVLEENAIKVENNNTIEVTNFNTDKKDNIYVKVNNIDLNANVNVTGYALEDKSNPVRPGGKLKVRDNYLEYVFCFDYFEIDKVVLQSNINLSKDQVEVYLLR